MEYTWKILPMLSEYENNEWRWDFDSDFRSPRMHNVPSTMDQTQAGPTGCDAIELNIELSIIQSKMRSSTPHGKLIKTGITTSQHSMILCNNQSSLFNCITASRRE